MSEAAPRPGNIEMESMAVSPQEIERIEAEPLFDFEELRQTLLEQVEVLQKQFKVKHRHLLRWAKKQGYTLHFLSEATSKLAVTGGLIGSLMAGVPQQIAHLPVEGYATPPNVQHTQAPESDMSPRKKDQLTVIAMRQKQVEEQRYLMAGLHQASTQQMSVEGSVAAAEYTSRLTGVAVTSELEGYRLNTTVGRIGAEQHLYRYPGDNLQDHFGSVEERRVFQSSGFAPGLGAYGYFAPSKTAMTPEVVEREKYYVAVQTFASPNWSGNVHQTYNWFKYRKVLVYHPVTKKAVVAVVGDAGPALSTGKNFGGSPEVMGALQAHDGYGTPPVLMFFVQDSAENPVPLGPVDFELPPLE
jgi:hypothetical protein